MSNIKNIKKLFCFLLAAFFILSFSMTSYAKETDNLEENVVTKSDTDVMSLEGPTVYVDLGEYGGSFTHI